MFIFIPFVCALLSIGTLLICMSQMIPHNLTARKSTVITLSYSLLVIYGKFFTGNSITVVLVHLLGMILLLCIPVLLFKGALWKKIAVLLLMITEFKICSLITQAVLSYTEMFSVAYTGPFYPAIYEVFEITLYILAGSISVILWKTVVSRRFPLLPLLLLILPVGQAAIVYSFLFTSWTTFWFFGILLSIAADLVLLIYTIVQERKTELEDKLRQTHQQFELEQYHYREVEERREVLDNIRREFKDQLLEITQLLRSGEKRSAQSLIRSLSDSINETSEHTYCAIPVVNAILTEKAKECTAMHIDLEVDLDIPAQLSVQQIHLCSILSNLLDNAINACKQNNSGYAPLIRLTSMVSGDYLFIKTVNPSDERPKRPLPGRGYGTRILADLSAQYGGDYQKEYQNGIFTAVVSLMTSDY